MFLKMVKGSLAILLAVGVVMGGSYLLNQFQIFQIAKGSSYGTLPAPNYDSGWVQLEPPELKPPFSTFSKRGRWASKTFTPSKTFTHNLGVSPNQMLVFIYAVRPGLGVTNTSIGGDQGYDPFREVEPLWGFCETKCEGLGYEEWEECLEECEEEPKYGKATESGFFYTDLTSKKITIVNFAEVKGNYVRVKIWVHR